MNLKSCPESYFDLCSHHNKYMGTYLLFSSMSVIFAVLFFEILSGRIIHDGRFYLYTLGVIFVYLPSVLMMVLREWVGFIAYLFVGGYLRLNYYVMEYGTLPGFDHYHAYSQLDQILQSHHLQIAEPAPAILMAFVKILPSVSTLSAWNTTIMVTCSLIPILIFVILRRIYSPMIGAIGAFISANDFVYILYLNQVKEHIPILLIIIAIFAILFREHLSHSGVIIISVCCSMGVILSHFTSMMIFNLILAIIVLHQVWQYIGGNWPKLGVFHEKTSKGVFIIVTTILLVQLSWMVFFQLRARRFDILVIANFFNTFLSGGIHDYGAVSVNAEVGALASQDTLFLTLYNWGYRILMIVGAVMGVKLVYRSRRLVLFRFLPMSIFMTGLPLVILATPVIPTILHAARIARFSMIFYVGFISLPFSYIFMSNGTNKSKSAEVIFIVFLLVSLTIPSTMYAATTHFDFESEIQETTKLSTKHVTTTRQIHALDTVDRFAQEPVNAPFQFDNIGKMRGIDIFIMPGTNSSITIIKRQTESTGAYIGRNNITVDVFHFDSSRHNRIYSDGDYVGLYEKHVRTRDRITRRPLPVE